MLRRLVRNHNPATGYHWHALVNAVGEVAGSPGEESERVLRDLLAFEGEVPLSDVSPLPHAMSPVDSLKSHAVQALGSWDSAKHRDVITRVAERASSDLLGAIARAHLPEARG